MEPSHRPSALRAAGSRSRVVSRIPLGVKLAFTAFMAVLVPVYWVKYGPANFLYLCDVALFLTLAGVWTENRLLISMPAVGILLSQLIWCVDFGVGLAGGRLTGLTDYMFDPKRTLFLRGLSLFHGWLPFLLLYLVWRVGYDRRALVAWTGLSWLVCLVCFFFPPPGLHALAGGALSNNLNYVFGLGERQEHWLPPAVYLVLWMVGLVVVFCVPAHLVLKRLFPGPRPVVALGHEA